MIEILRRVGEEGVEGSPGQEEHRDEERSEAEGSLEERLAGVDLGQGLHCCLHSCTGLMYVMCLVFITLVLRYVLHLRT